MMHHPHATHVMPPLHPSLHHPHQVNMNVRQQQMQTMHPARNNMQQQHQNQNQQLQQQSHQPHSIQQRDSNRINHHHHHHQQHPHHTQHQQQRIGSQMHHHTATTGATSTLAMPNQPPRSSINSVILTNNTQSSAPSIKSNKSHPVSNNNSNNKNISQAINIPQPQHQSQPKHHQQHYHKHQQQTAQQPQHQIAVADNNNSSNKINPQQSTLRNLQQSKENNNNSNNNNNPVAVNNNPKIIQLDNTDIILNDSLANTKEKTPMCLVNELARYNKIQHQYRLTSENGPAHRKSFTVTLKLGDEEYTSEGARIKKAQHAAACEAIKSTKYKHPPAKTNRTPVRSNSKTRSDSSVVGSITPTVELNALAMKLGEPTVYIVEEQPALQQTNILQNVPNSQYPLQQTQPFVPSQFHNGPMPRNMNNYPPSRYKNDYDKRVISKGGYKHQMRISGDVKITLVVGQRKFLGVGPSLQLARHDAAARALEVLKPLDTSLNATESADSSVTEDANSDLKSPISLVHEMALKRKMTVSFEVQSEKGPPHMKLFITLCKVGNVVTEGEGNGKKISKKRAAEKMMEELKKIPIASPVRTNKDLLKQKKRPVVVKKKARNLIKEKPAAVGTEELNPISKLIQIQQARKEKEPIYTLVEERGTPKRREFVMEVAASGKKVLGTGPNKKVAKKRAAENILYMMGIPITSAPEKENISNNSKEVPDNKPRKVTFNEKTEIVREPTPPANSIGGSAGRQIVPGLLVMQQENKPFTMPNKSLIGTHQTATIAKEFLDSGNSPTAEALNKTTPASTTSGIGPKNQLLYLSELLGFEVKFSDFPKANHGEFLTLISLNTEPAQLFHGTGSTLEASHDQASMIALKILSEIGLDNVKPKKAKEEPSSCAVTSSISFPTTTSPTATSSSTTTSITATTTIATTPKPILSNGMKK